MDFSVPILRNHDHTQPPIGKLSIQNNRLTATFNDAITEDEFWAIFPSAGVSFMDMTLDEGNSRKISVAQFIEFSCTPQSLAMSMVERQEVGS